MAVTASTFKSPPNRLLRLKSSRFAFVLRQLFAVALAIDIFRILAAVIAIQGFIIHTILPGNLGIAIGIGTSEKR